MFSRLKFGLIVVGSVGWLTGCSPHSSSPDSSEEPASFGVAKAEGAFTDTENHPQFSIPKAKTLSLKACLADIQYSRNVTNHAFIIQGGDTDQEKTSDAAGCIFWSENIVYNHLADAANLTIHRTIVAKGFQRGQRTISLAINPWSNEVTYLKEKSVPNLKPEDQTKLRLLGAGTQHALWSDAVRLSIEPMPAIKLGSVYHVDVKLDPKVILKSANGETYPLSISQGSFKARISLIRVPLATDKERHELVAQSPYMDISHLVEGSLAASTSLVVSGHGTLCSYELGVDVIPLNGPEGLGPMHGLYLMGGCEGLEGVKFAQLKNGDQFRAENIAKFSIEDYTGTKSNEKGLNTLDYVQAKPNSTGNGGVSEASAFAVPRITSTSDDVFVTESTKIKRHYFYIPVCLGVNVNRAAGAYQNLTVTGLNGITQKNLKTDLQTGCVLVHDSVPVDSFAPVCWQTGKIHVVNNLLSLDETIPVKVSAMNAGAPAIYDLRQPYISEANTVNDDFCKKQKTGFNTSFFNMTKSDYEYEVNSNMDLIVIKDMNWQVSISMNRPNMASNTDFRNEPLPPGDYKLRWAYADIMARDPRKLQGEQIFGIGEQIVKITSASQIQDRVKMKISNLKSLGNLNTLYFDLYPVGVSVPSLEKTVFSANMAMSHDYAATPIIPLTNVPGLLPTLFQRYRQFEVADRQRKERLGRIDVFAKTHNLQLVDLSKGNGVSTLSAAQLNKILLQPNFTPAMANVFCQEWVNSFLQSQVPLSNGQQVQPIAQETGISGIFQRGILNLMPKSPKDYILKDLCIHNSEKNPRAFFDVEYHYIPHGLNLKNLHTYALPSRPLHLELGFEVARSRSENFSNSYSSGQGFEVGVDSSAFGHRSGVSHVGKGPGGVLPHGSGGGGNPAGKGFQFGFGVHDDFSMSHDRSETNVEENGVTVGGGVEFQVDTVVAQAENAFSDFEKCMVIRMNPSLFLKKNLQFDIDPSFISYLTDNKTEGEILKPGFNAELLKDPVAMLLLARRGYAICSGKTYHSPTPQTFKEKYFVVYQKPTESMIMNAEADANRPFFLAMRGLKAGLEWLSYAFAWTNVPKTFAADLNEAYLDNENLIPLFLHEEGAAPGHIVQ